MSTEYKKKKLWLLGPYSTAIQWIFEFIILSALPVLAAGSIFAITDLLTGGLLSNASPVFGIVWAVGQAVAIELLFFSAFMRVAQAAHQRNWGKVVGWLIVGGILAVPSFQAAVVYGQVHTFGITVSMAIQQLGISDMQWIVVRALAVIFVGALEGIASYTSEGTQKSVAMQVREMEERSTLSQASAKMNAARAGAWIKAGRSAAKAAFNREDDVEETPDEEPVDDGNVTPIRRGKGGKRKKVVSESVVEGRIRKLLEGRPNMPLNELMKRAHVSLSTASKWKRIVQAEGSASA